MKMPKNKTKGMIKELVFGNRHLLKGAPDLKTKSVDSTRTTTMKLKVRSSSRPKI